MEQRSVRRGRPPRAPIEVIRAVTWYYAVRRASKWTERHLETHFDKLDRVGLGKHRGTRWNKYKAGITTPSRELVEQVGRVFKGTHEVFDHPVWRLAGSESISAMELRDLIAALPRDLAVLFIRLDATAQGEFWVRGDLDHRSAVMELMKQHQANLASHLTAIAGLLALVHDARTRQKEEQHFEVHLAIAAVASVEARRQGDKFINLWSWRLESLLLENWLETEYTKPAYREVLEELRSMTSGPLVPWAPRQTSLKLGRGPNKREAADLQNSRGYWAGQRILEWQRENRLSA